MHGSSVCAVVFPTEGSEAPAATIAGLERQTRPPGDVIVVGSSFREALGAALEGDSDWLWLLDGSVVPEPTALEHLLEALAPLDWVPPPILLASKVVTPDGSIDRGSLPVPEVMKTDLALAALDRHQLALRVARSGSLLVHRRGFEWRTPPRTGSGIRDDLSWTASLLKHEPGLLVPTSLAVRFATGERTRAEVVSRWRLVTGDALRRMERPWFVFRFAEEALEAMRARAARRRAGAAGRGAGRARRRRRWRRSGA